MVSPSRFPHRRNRPVHGNLAIRLLKGIWVLFVSVSVSRGLHAQDIQRVKSDSGLANRNILKPISGIVLGPDGLPLGGARVYLRSRPYTSRPEIQLGETLTDSDGNFEFVGIEKPIKGDSRRLYPLDVIAVKARHSIRWKKLLNAERSIQLRLKRDTVFRGLLRDDSGKAVKDATIRVQNLMSLNTIGKINIPSGSFPSMNGDSYLDASQPTIQIMAKTDAKGKFAIRGLPNRVGMTLLVDDRRFVKNKIYAATTNEELPDIPIAMARKKTDASNGKSDEVRRLLNTRRTYSHAKIHTNSSVITVSRGVHLIVKVVADETGEPIANATVHSVNGTNHRDNERVQTDAKGHVEFFQCRPGKFWVYTSAPTNQRLIPSRHVVDLSEGGFKLERVVRLKPGALVSGRVVNSAGEGISGAELSYQAENTSVQPGAKYVINVQRERSDSEGRFQFVTPPVKGRISILRFPLPYRLARAETPGSTHAVMISPTLDDPITDLEFTLNKAKPIPFRFVNELDEPVAVSAKVRFAFSSNSYRELPIETDDSGLVDLAESMPNTQPVTAIQMMIRSNDHLRAAFLRTKEIASLSHDTSVVRLHPVASVRGRVVDKETRLPIEDAIVSLSVSFGNGRGQNVDRMKANENGEFEFHNLIPNMTYSVGFSATEHLPLNSYRTRFETKPMAEHQVEVELIPKKPKQLAELKKVKVPSIRGLAPNKAIDLLIEEYNAANQAYRTMVRKREFRDLVNQIVQLREPTQFYAPVFMRVANENKGTSAELRCLIWLCKAGLVAGTAEKYRHLKAEAADRILENYWDSKQLHGAESDVIYASSNRYEAAMQLSDSPYREIRGQAHFTAAAIVDQRYRDPYRGQLDSLRERAIELYEIVIENYAELPHWQFGTIGKKAAISLFALKFIDIGKIAPEMEGVDLDGRPIRLSDFRGNVVVIHYWEGGLSNFETMNRFAAENQGKPLVILGVNTDNDREQAISAAKDAKAVEYRHLHDLTQDIHAKWSGGWPTTHVIGHDGKILFLGARRSSEPLEDVIDGALKAIEKDDVERQ